jgi:hypothetical protein
MIQPDCSAMKVATRATMPTRSGQLMRSVSVRGGAGFIVDRLGACAQV